MSNTSVAVDTGVTRSRYQFVGMSSGGQGCVGIVVEWLPPIPIVAASLTLWWQMAIKSTNCEADGVTVSDISPAVRTGCPGSPCVSQSSSYVASTVPLTGANIRDSSLLTYLIRSP